MDIKGLAIPLVTKTFDILGTARIPATLKLGAVNTYNSETDETTQVHANTVSLDVVRTKQSELQKFGTRTPPEEDKDVIILDRSDLPAGVKINQEDIVEIGGSTRQITAVETDPIDVIYILTLA